MKNVRNIMTVIFILVILGALIIPTQIKAKETDKKSLATFIIQASKTENIQKNDQITLTIHLKPERTLDEDINTYKMKIDYNEGIFEKINKDNFKNQGNWIRLRYNENTKEVIAINGEGLSKEETIVTITLKVKDIKNFPKIAEIKLQDIEIAGSREKKEELKDAKITLNFAYNQQVTDPDIPGTNPNEEDSNIDNPGDTQNQKPEIKPEEKPSTNKHEQNEGKYNDDTLATGKLPQTGEKGYPILFIIIISLIGITVLNYKRLYGKRRKILSMVLVIFVLQYFITQSLGVNLRHVNKTTTQYPVFELEDIVEAQEHIIGLNKIEDDERLSYIDIDKNNKINIIDIAKMVNNVATIPFMENVPEIKNTGNEKSIKDGIWQMPILENEKLNSIYTSYNSVLEKSGNFIIGQNSLISKTEKWPNNYAIEFTIDCEEFEFYGCEPFRLSVDEGDGYKLASYKGQNKTSEHAWHHIKFQEKKQRNIKLEMSTTFGGVNISKQDSMTKINRQKGKTALFMGTDITQGYTLNEKYLAYPQVVSNILGFECINNGIKGTGYLATDSSQDVYQYYNRLTYELDTTKPDILIVESGMNDCFHYTNKDIIKEAERFYQAINQKTSDIPVIIIGVYWPKDAPQLRTVIELNQQLSEKALQHGFYFIDLLAGKTIEPNGTLLTEEERYITGDGFLTAEKENGNADFYISSDSVHIGYQGHKYFGIKLSKEIGKIIKQESENKIDYTDIDAKNTDKRSYWTNIPIVSQELLDKEEVTIGGEGCQWPLSITTSSDGKYLFYGTDVSGIYRSTDNGKTWDKSMKNYTAGGASDIVVDPNNSERVIAFGVNVAPTYTTGIHLSEDGGESWSFKQNFMIDGHRDITNNIAYDATSYNAKLGYTTDIYLSLIYKKDRMENTKLELTDMISDNYTDGKSQCNKAGLYKSTDGGYTWNMISNILYDGIVQVNPKTGTVYIARDDGLYASYNKGKSFQKIQNGNIWSLDIIKTQNAANIYYTTTEGAWISNNDGKTFTKIQSESFPKVEGKHPQNLKVSPVNSNNMVMFFGDLPTTGGTYGKIYFTNDGGKTWKESKYDDSFNFMHYILERRANFVWSATDENRVWDFVTDWISSSYDAGKTFRWDSNGLSEILVGGRWHFNLYNSDIIFIGSQDYNSCVTLDGGKTWKYLDMYTYSNEHGSSNWPYNGFIYGGYAADEKTYFGAAGTSWYSTKYLTITHDGGETHTAHIGEPKYAISSGYQDRLLGQNVTISSYQSPKNPDILFCGDLRSSDRGRTWSKMKDKNGNVAVTGVNTHDRETGRLFGINDYLGCVMYSDDDGDTWEVYNKETFNPYSKEPSYIEDLSFDSINKKLYVAWNWGYLSVIEEDGNKMTNLTSNIPKMLQFEGAPTKEQLGRYYSERRIRTVAVDPNNPLIIYAGGSTYGYRGDSDLYRSCDGGKTWDVVSINGTNSIVSLENGDYGGVDPVSMNVKPETGELWVAGNCTGFSKLTPPYKMKK